MKCRSFGYQYFDTMGKVKHVRQKFHITKKSDSKDDKSKDVPQYTPLPVAPISSNVFAGLNISFDSLNKLKHDPIPEDVNEPAPNLIKLNNKEKPANKKDKIRQRRENLLKKIDAVQQAKKESKLKLKRQKTPIIGDLHPLKDALPSLESLLKLKPNPGAMKTGIAKIDAQVKQKQNLANAGNKLSKKQRKEMKKQNLKKLAKEYKQRYNNLQKVFADETFKKNPRDAIATHIKLTLADQSISPVTLGNQKILEKKVTPVKGNPARRIKKDKK